MVEQLTSAAPDPALGNAIMPGTFENGRSHCSDLWLLISLNPSSSALPVVQAQPNLRLHSPMPPAGGDSAE